MFTIYTAFLAFSMEMSINAMNWCQVIVFWWFPLQGDCLIICIMWKLNEEWSLHSLMLVSRWEYWGLLISRELSWAWSGQCVEYAELFSLPLTGPTPSAQMFCLLLPIHQVDVPTKQITFGMKRLGHYSLERKTRKSKTVKSGNRIILELFPKPKTIRTQWNWDKRKELQRAVESDHRMKYGNLGNSLQQ